jgi:hypothetical protein
MSTVSTKDLGATARSRPVYPYPALARYSGQGDPNDASSYGRGAPLVTTGTPGWAGADLYRPRTR